MTVKLFTNDKIAETSSKGNQEKWFDSDTNKWYKLDQFGYEALTETIIYIAIFCLSSLTAKKFCKDPFADFSRENYIGNNTFKV